VSKFLKWLVQIPAEPVSPGAQVQAAITSKPLVLNPSTMEHLKFAEWRAAHIQRWLDDPATAGSPKRSQLESERDMYISLLRLCRQVE